MSDHARLGASNSSGWLTCTKYPEMNEGRERKATIYTAEGTAAHAFAEGHLLDLGTPKVGDTIDVEGFQIEVTQEMAQHCYVYTDECERLAEDAEFVNIEQRVHLDELWNMQPPEPLFGTADFACVVGDTAYLRDLKYGKGVPVEVNGNTQLLYYGLGLYYELTQSFRDTVEWFDLGIVQPRVDHPDGHVRSLKIHRNDLLNWGYNDLKPVVDNIAEGKTTYTPGKHCRWCMASGSCEALATRAMTEAKTTFAEQNPVAPGHLSDTELANILNFAPIARDWLNKIQSEAMARIEAGHAIPGWKMVPKRAIRKWTDDRLVLDILKGAGVNIKDVAEIKVGTVAAIEKTLKHEPDIFDQVRHLIDGTSSGYTLAPVDDKRDAVTSTRPTADDAFDQVDPSAISM